MKLLIASLLLVAGAKAQQLELRGTVVEGALGIAGVTVTLYQFGPTPATATTRTVAAVTSTDQKGGFTLHPSRAGDYYVEVQKDGYFAESFDGPTVDPIDTIGDPVSIDQAFQHLDRAVAPQWDILRADPRFNQCLIRMGLLVAA